MQKRISEKLQEELGNYIAIRCNRYTYRGKVLEVGEDFVVLEKAHLVECEGPARRTAPSSEDCIGTIVLPFVGVKAHEWQAAEGIECIFKPLWADYPCSCMKK